MTNGEQIVELRKNIERAKLFINIYFYAAWFIYLSMLMLGLFLESVAVSCFLNFFYISLVYNKKSMQIEIERLKIRTKINWDD